jgi:hypothetical protein
MPTSELSDATDPVLVSPPADAQFSVGVVNATPIARESTAPGLAQDFSQWGDSVL